MINPIFKESYNGQGIYWFGGNNYGDETLVLAHSIRECRAIIDAKLKAQADARPDCLKYWDTLSHDVRNRWRKLSQTTELSAPELAFTNR